MAHSAMRASLLAVASVAALAMATVAPEAGTIVFLVATAISIVLLRSADLMNFRRPVVSMPVLALLLLSFSYVVRTGSFVGLSGLVFFLPLLSIVPWSLMKHAMPVESRGLVGVLGLCGVAGAAAVAVNAFLLTGAARAGETIANPIHFADMALVAGLLALTGCVFSKGASRYIYLSGPLLGCLAILFSGTKGALLALVCICLIGIVQVVALRLISLRVLVFGTGALAALLVLAWVGGLSNTSTVQRILLDISQLTQTGMPSDESTVVRLQMYEGSLRAFLANPLLGYGPFDYIDAASAHAPVPFVGMPHLHNDLANFGVSAGVPGVVAYFLILLAPLMEVLRSRPSAARSGILVVTTMIVFGYFIMGLTNATFGILSLTVYFSAFCVVVTQLTEPLPRPVPSEIVPST